MADKTAAAAAATPALTLERVNTPPAQTWNYLRANDVTLTVPQLSRKGDVYFALPRLFEGVECGMGEQVTAWVASQAADARYVEVRAGERRAEPIVVDVTPGQVADTGILLRAGAEATVLLSATNPDASQDNTPEAAPVSAPTGGNAPEATPAPSPTSDNAQGGTLGTVPFAPQSGANGDNERAKGTVPSVLSAPPAPPTSATLLRIILERDAKLHLLEFVTTAGTQHLESVGIAADEHARVDVRQFFLGGQTCAAGLTCALDGPDARFDLSCRYLGKDDERLDLNHVVRMRGRRGRADVRESGVLDGAARKSLRATIDLVHGARGAQGSELESVLVLSDDVTNKTMPVILCDEDDVAGNHGATIGSVGPEQIQYLRDRGLTQQEAEALYVRALFDEALIAAPTAEVRAAVLARATQVLGAEVAGDLVEGLGLGDATCAEGGQPR